MRLGDTLAAVARDTGVPLETLVALNHLQDPNVVVVGTVLTLGPQTATESRAPVASAPAATPEPPSPAISHWLKQRGINLPAWMPFREDAVRQGAAVTGALLLLTLVGVLVWQLGVALWNGSRILLRALRFERASAAVETVPSVAGRTETRDVKPAGPGPLQQVGRLALSRSVTLGGTTLRFLRRELPTPVRGVRAAWSTATSLHRKERPEHASATRDNYGRRGTELLRIGLVAEAEALFREGLADAERRNSPDERDRYIELLNELARRVKAPSRAAGDRG